MPSKSRDIKATPPLGRAGSMSEKTLDDYKRTVERGDPITLSPEDERRFETAVARAEADLGVARVNFRWGTRQVNLVKQAAEAAGIPYQIYIKHVLYRQALEDVRAAKG